MANISPFWLRFAAGAVVPSAPPIESDDPNERISMSVWEKLPESECRKIMNSYLPDPDRVFRPNYLTGTSVRTRRTGDQATYDEAA